MIPIYSIPTEELIFFDNYLIKETLTELLVLFAQKFPESKTSVSIIMNYYYSQF
mgnify:CR=1 FL=1